jgi:hypothetical protein
MKGSVLSNLQTLSSTSTESDASKKSKRRSLLPQFSRKVSGDEQIEVGIKEEDEDGSGSRSTSEDTRTSGDSQGRKAIDEDRKAMPPPSRLTRPVSMIPPRGASQRAKTQLSQSEAHSRSMSKDMHIRNMSKDTDKDEDAGADADAARADSLAALSGTPASPSKMPMPESGLKRTGSSRLPQSPKVGVPNIPGAPVIPSRTTSSRKTTTHSRGISSLSDAATARFIPEERITRNKAQAEQAPEEPSRTSPPRAPATRSRPVSQVIGQQTAASVMSRGRPASQMLPPTSSKPAFNTFQQHYSPAKSSLPKPPLPSAKTLKPAPVSEEDATVTFDVARQQIELLQLSLLHQASTQCSREYTASAKRKLSKMHTKLRKEYETIRATELVHQRVANLSALESWCRDPNLLVENLQILSLVYSDLTSLMEDGSRHADVLNMFELWMKEAEAPLPGVFIQPLPDEWKAAHASLALKLRSIQRNLGVLPPAHAGSDEGSGLQIVLKGCKSLVDGMLRELDLMIKLEKDLLARETNKIEEEVKVLALDDVGMQGWVPVWQSVA